MSLLKFNELDIKLEIESDYRGHRRCIKNQNINGKKECLEYENESLKNHIDLVYDYIFHNPIQDRFDKQDLQVSAL